MESDKRQSRRIGIKAPVTVEGISNTLEAVVKNIGVHGMCFSLPKNIAFNDKEVLLTFSPVERIKPLKVMGWVVHNSVNNDMADTGVTFMFLSENDEKLLEEYVNTLSKDEVQ
jgi:hypothetical protein